jgi:hypothetical protein
MEEVTVRPGWSLFPQQAPADKVDLSAAAEKERAPDKAPTELVVEQARPDPVPVAKDLPEAPRVALPEVPETPLMTHVSDGHMGVQARTGMDRAVHHVSKTGSGQAGYFSWTDMLAAVLASVLAVMSFRTIVASKYN